MPSAVWDIHHLLESEKPRHREGGRVASELGGRESFVGTETANWFGKPQESKIPQTLNLGTTYIYVTQHF